MGNMPEVVRTHPVHGRQRTGNGTTPRAMALHQEQWHYTKSLALALQLLLTHFHFFLVRDAELSQVKPHTLLQLHLDTPGLKALSPACTCTMDCVHSLHSDTPGLKALSPACTWTMDCVHSLHSDTPAHSLAHRVLAHLMQQRQDAQAPPLHHILQRQRVLAGQEEPASVEEPHIAPAGAFTHVSTHKSKQMRQAHMSTHEHADGHLAVGVHT